LFWFGLAGSEPALELEVLLLQEAPDLQFSAQLCQEFDKYCFKPTKKPTDTVFFIQNWNFSHTEEVSL
jgi:hypothetical protein